MDHVGVSKVKCELSLRQGSPSLHRVVDVASKENSCMRLGLEWGTHLSQHAWVKTWLCKCNPYQQMFKSSCLNFVVLVPKSVVAV